MLTETVDNLLNRIPGLQENGLQLARAIHNLVLDGGPSTRDVVDLLHGTWLGHPLHPVLTDVVVGAWTLGSLLDLVSLFDGSSRVADTADLLTDIGNMAALPTILSGLADFSTIPKAAADVGLTHAVCNDIAFSLYLASAAARRSEDRDRAVALSLLGAGVLTVGAYLGGHLVYDKNVGVNHAQSVSEPQAWTAVLAGDELGEEQPQRVEVAERPVLLYRRGDHVMAIGAVCPHAGGPLEQGQFDGHQVQCPWHQSVFDLQNGSVVHGPSTYPAPNYEARLRDGQVEVRLAPQPL